MKVLHVETGRHLYGGGQQVLALLRGLDERDVENTLVCAKGSAIAEQAAPFARVIELGLAGDIDIGFIGRLRRSIRQYRPELVHLHSRRGADVLGGIAARLAGVPAVLSRRVDNPESRAWVALKYRLYAHVITISEEIRRVLLQAGLPSQRVTCVRSAIDAGPWAQPCDFPGFRQAFGLPSSSPVIGMVAQLIPRKGHHDLIAALPAVLRHAPDLQVILFGRGPLEDEIRQVLRHHGLTEQVHLAGFRGDLERWLGCLDIVVHPALMEGLGVALLQAGAAGVPIVATRAGGIPEVVEHGRNGLLVEPGDRDALANSLIALLDDPDRRLKMGAAGRKRIGELFSTNGMIDGNLAVYRQVLARGG